MSTENRPRMKRAQMEELLASEEQGVLCLSRKGEPYAIPISYGWIDGQIVCHCGMKGEKLEILRENPHACFVVSQYPNPITPHAGKCDFNFRSVLCFGTVRELTDLDERQQVLIKFRNHFYARLKLPSKTVPLAEAKGVNCIVMTIDRMTGRCKIV